MAKLKQGQLTLFLKGSDTETQPVEEERESEESVDSQPPTKKTKHREVDLIKAGIVSLRGLVWGRTKVAKVCSALSVVNTIKQLNG